MTCSPQKPVLLASLWKATLNLLLPPRCIGSGRVVDAPGMLSPAFWSTLSFIDAPFCDTCGTPFGFGAVAGTICAECLDNAPEFDRARSAVVYNDASRKLVIDFKYGDRLHAVQTFTPWLARAGAELLAGAEVVLPVPLHYRRLWQRRFNQSAILGEALARHTGKAFLPDGLIRRRHTDKQKGLSRKERHENVRGAFAVNEKANLRGQNIVLVDDVFTSGATLNECARVLKKAGAGEVYVLTIARVTRDEVL
ncbi:MAG TPA: ComF family protein [Patescibacteria group bacterium]|nr:ComF family protein [Patescibacteria group bacterium]